MEKERAKEEAGFHLLSFYCTSAFSSLHAHHATPTIDSFNLLFLLSTAFSICAIYPLRQSQYVEVQPLLSTQYHTPFRSEQFPRRFPAPPPPHHHYRQELSQEEQGCQKRRQQRRTNCSLRSPSHNGRSRFQQGGDSPEKDKDTRNRQTTRFRDN